MATQQRWLPWALLAVSVLGNFAFAGYLLVDHLNAPEDRVGLLTRDVEVGSFSGTRTIFRLPRGLTVRDASPRFFAGAGQFEPFRFSIIVTADDPKLVNYAAPKNHLHEHSEYYSVELEDRRLVESDQAVEQLTTAKGE